MTQGSRCCQLGLDDVTAKSQSPHLNSESEFDASYATSDSLPVARCSWLMTGVNHPSQVTAWISLRVPAGLFKLSLVIGAGAVGHWTWKGDPAQYPFLSCPCSHGCYWWLRLSATMLRLRARQPRAAAESPICSARPDHHSEPTPSDSEAAYPVDFLIVFTFTFHVKGPILCSWLNFLCLISGVNPQLWTSLFSSTVGKKFKNVIVYDFVAFKSWFRK